ncbi:MAG: CsbD family protein [Planctomycetota bacterium]
MNELKFKGDWNQLKGKLQQKYAQLTDDDLMYAKGQEDELLGRLQKKLGQKQDQIRKLIADL